MSIENERQFDFLRDLVANISDVSIEDGDGSTGASTPRRRAASCSGRSRHTALPGAQALVCCLF